VIMIGTEPGLERVAELRVEIERIDEQLVRLLAERCGVARAISDCRREAGTPLHDSAREAAVVRRAAAIARDVRVESDLVRDIFWLVIRLARNAQRGAA
jgi:chorismate mutase / prephenate dehydrogenase